MSADRLIAIEIFFIVFLICQGENKICSIENKIPPWEIQNRPILCHVISALFPHTDNKVGFQTILDTID